MPAPRRAWLVALALSLAACAREGDGRVEGGPALDVRAACHIVREPGNMVAIVTGATLTVEAIAHTDSERTVRVDLVDAGEVVDTASIDVPPLRRGARAELDVGFPAAPEGGWPARPDARCVARLAR